MPTPFTHLEIAQRLLRDHEFPRAYYDLLSRYRSAFQLGSIVADARVSSGIGRHVTHFYSYDLPMIEHPWRVMLKDYPSLKTPQDDQHLVFLAGYVAHLATDESWALKMVRPKFFLPEWEGVSRQDKFIALHLILIYMDERDEAKLEDWQANSLADCIPNKWLPFMPDDVLCSWRDLVAEQIASDGISQTLDILGKRLKLDPALLRNMLDNPDIMNERLWNHIPRTLQALVEDQIYAFTRDQVCFYLSEFM